MPEESDSKNTGSESQGSGGFKSFDEYLTGQPDAVKALYEAHTDGLRSALKKEREQNKAFNDQFRELKDKAEKGSELEKELTRLQAEHAASERHAMFVEQAIRPENGCINIRAAYAVATVGDLFKKNGEPDWEEIKKATPESFGKQGNTTSGKSGDGTGDGGKPGLSMNEILRQAARGGR